MNKIELFRTSYRRNKATGQFRFEGKTLLGTVGASAINHRALNNPLGYACRKIGLSGDWYRVSEYIPGLGWSLWCCGNCA